MLILECPINLWTTFGSIFFSKHLVANVCRKLCGWKSLISLGSLFSCTARTPSFSLILFKAFFISFSTTYLTQGLPIPVVNTKSFKSSVLLQRLPSSSFSLFCFFFWAFNISSISPKNGISLIEFTVLGVTSIILFSPL